MFEGERTADYGGGSQGMVMATVEDEVYGTRLCESVEGRKLKQEIQVKD